MENIKQWYKTDYPSDELGDELDPAADFNGLFRELDRYGDPYEYLGVHDSLVRERVFEGLAKVMDCDYAYIYEQWLNAPSKIKVLGTIEEIKEQVNGNHKI